MDYEVVIIGAGMAGLGAANHLVAKGFNNFQIIEANSKAGGRVETVPVGDSVIDLGAQWVHGVDTELYKIAVKHDLIHAETSDEGLGHYIRDDGYIFDDFMVKKVDFEVGKILTACENFVDADVYPKSVGEFLVEHFQKFVNEAAGEYDESLLWELFDWHVRFHLIDNSCSDLNRLSAREWGKYSCLGKDGQAHINLKGGYGGLIEALLLNVSEDRIMYNTEVEQINHDNDGMELICNDARSIKAGHVIVTSSLGVLKRNNIFKFKLPTVISDCIGSFGFEGMGKVFLLFNENWWKCDGFQLIWRRNTIDKEGNWTRHLSGFDNVLDQPNMLVGWLSGLGVKEMEDTSSSLVGQQCVDLLRNFLKRDDIPYPKQVYKSSWSSKKWVQGGYSYTTPDSDRLRVTPSMLNDPVYFDAIPRVLFAGEACHESHFSTTHGAYESGQNQAKFLLDFLMS